MPDVDIDFFDRDSTLKLFKHTPATIIKDEKVEKHKTGVYFHAVPEHPVTKHASIDYKVAEDRGYFKIHMLNVNIYKHVKSEQELVELMIQEPDWEMLQDNKIVDNLGVEKYLLLHLKGVIKSDMFEEERIIFDEIMNNPNIIGVDNFNPPNSRTFTSVSYTHLTLPTKRIV